MNSDFRKASEVINALVSGLEEGSLERANSFARDWKTVAGDKIASHSRIIDVNRGNIIIEVDHPGWSQQILFKKNEIVRTLSGRFPELGIRNIVLRVVSECRTPYKRSDETVGAGVPRASNEEPDVAIDGTMPDDLQNVFSRLKDSMRKGKPKD